MKYTYRIFFHLLLFVVTLSLTAQNSEKSYFPNKNGNWKKIEVTKSGWDSTALKNVVDYVGSQNSSGLLILVNGKILLEEYWTESKDNYFEDIASIQKSLVSLLCAKAIAKGLLDINLPVSNYLGSGWSNIKLKNEKKILVKHLLSMSSGLNKHLKFVSYPEEEWAYNTKAYVRLGEILETITNKDLNTITEEWITRPIGIKQSTWIVREGNPNNRLRNPYGYKANLRDLGKLSLLTLHQGYWKHKNIIGNEAYLQKALQPSQNTNLMYGYLFWLNTNQQYHQECPENMAFMFGKGDKYVFLFPTEEVIVVRLGEKAQKGFSEKLLSLVMTAMDN